EGEVVAAAVVPVAPGEYGAVHVEARGRPETRCDLLPDLVDPHPGKNQGVPPYPAAETVGVLLREARDTPLRTTGELEGLPDTLGAIQPSERVEGEAVVQLVLAEPLVQRTRE